MDRRNLEVFRQFLNKKVRMLGFRLIDRKKHSFCMKNDFHILAYIENELYSWELQMTIDLATDGLIHSMLFLHPIVITDATKSEYIKFANTVNLYLKGEMGRFWVNEDNDFCYECYLPEHLIEYERELESQLFKRPFAHFKDCLTPLMSMKTGMWSSEKAIDFFDKLHKDGYVDNTAYELI